MRRYILSAMLLFSGFLGGVAPAQQKLAWKFNEGDHFYLEEKTLLKQIIKVLGNTEEKEEARINVFGFLVQAKTADGVVLVQTIEEMKIVPKKGRADPMAQQTLDQIRGQQFTITLNNQGRIVRFEGYEKFIHKLSGHDPKEAKLLGAMLPINWFKNLSEAMFSNLPDKAVTPQDAWKRETYVPMGPLGGFKMMHTYKYEGEEKGLAVISRTATLVYNAPQEGTGGLPFKILKGNFTAHNIKNRLLFDNQLGRPNLSIGSFGMRGTLTLEILNMPVAMEMNLEQTSETRWSATKPGMK